MEFEFDKEIDILLRQSARRGAMPAESVVAHLDADEINAFAEQSLSEKSRMRAMEHFADCSRCRKILSNLTIFNAEPESEIVHTEEKTIAAAIEIPWYKKLFMFPQIAYAMGALALVFGGIIAVIVLKDSTQNYSSDVARMEKQSESPNVFSADKYGNANVASNTAANYSNSAGTTPDSALPASSNSMTAVPTPEAKDSQPTSAVNSVVPEARDQLTEVAKPAPKPEEKTSDDAEIVTKEKRDGGVSAAPPPAAPKKENNYNLDGTSTKNSDMTKQQSVTTADSDVARQQTEPSQNQASRNQTQIMPDSRSVQNLPRVTRRTERSREEEALSGSSANAKTANKSVETKSIDGKNFRRSDGVWYDVNYRNQKTINLRRNSNDYKKLDANLRSIADKLGGVVVIVSGNKAYRIQ